MEIISRVTKRIKREFFSRIYFDRGDFTNSIFIAGSGRSGTTWLADAIAQIYNYRLMFEPFWHLHKELDKTKDFFHHRYIEPNNSRYDDEIRYILGGDYKNYKTNFNFKFGPYDGRVIKDICSNLFLPRIKQVNSTMPIIFVIRSPFSVVNSRNEKKKWGRPWGDHAHLFLEQDKLIEIAGSDIKPNSEVQDHAISYCFENYMPLKDHLENKSSFLLIKYEDLFNNTGQILKRIVKYIDKSLSIDRSEYKLNYQDKFLMTSKKSKEKIKNSSQKKISLSSSEIDDIEKILNEFNMFELFESLSLGYER